MEGLERIKGKGSKGKRGMMGMGNEGKELVKGRNDMKTQWREEGLKYPKRF